MCHCHLQDQLVVTVVIVGKRGASKDAVVAIVVSSSGEMGKNWFDDPEK